jgi:hypothetical protein
MGMLAEERSGSLKKKKLSKSKKPTQVKTNLRQLLHPRAKPRPTTIDPVRDRDNNNNTNTTTTVAAPAPKAKAVPKK